jgi:hypothetical protein
MELEGLLKVALPRVPESRQNLEATNQRIIWLVFVNDVVIRVID